MKFRTSIILFLLLSSFFTQVFAQNYDPNFFPIGVWSVKGDFRSVDNYLVNPNTAAPMHETLFSDLENRGFNAAFMSLDPIGYTIDTLLDIAHKHNIKIISSMQHLAGIIADSNDNPPTGEEIHNAIVEDSINLLKKSPAVLGYYLYDEPLPGWIDFAKLKEAKDSLLQLSGGNHPILSVWNDVQQMSYIDGYLNLEVLMADTYPISDSTSEGSLVDYMPAYFSSYGDPDDPSTIGPATPSFSEYIEQIRQDHCNDNNRPFWIVFQSFGDDVQYDADNPDASWAFWRQVQPKEIRLQAWIALMQGAKGLWYFLYETESPVLMGMLDVDGNSTPRLDEATAINTQVNKISPILLKLDVVEDAQVTVNQGEARLHDDLSENTDDKYIIVTNTDYFNQQDIQVSIPKSDIGYEVHSVMNNITDENIPFTETATTIDFVASLDRADGALYHISAQAPLAIEMVSFTASKYHHQGKLTWTTLSEKDNLGFNIQRSQDGITWENLGFIQGIGSSHTEHTYTFWDTQPHSGVNYYRLQQQDLDGTTSYSNYVQLFFADQQVTIFPNPTKETIHFLTSGQPVEQVMIYNTLGQLIHQSKPVANQLDVNFLDKGVYVLTGKAGDTVFRERLVIRP